MTRRPSKENKCLLLSEKIGRFKRLKSLIFQGDEVGISRKHPIVVGLLAYVSSLRWLHDTTIGKVTRVKRGSDPWMCERSL